MGSKEVHVNFIPPLFHKVELAEELLPPACSLVGCDVVASGIGVLRQQAATQESLILVLYIYERQTADDVFLKLVVLLRRIVVGIHVRILNHVKSDIVLRIQQIVLVYLLVDMLRYLLEHLVARLLLIYGLQPIVDAGSKIVMDMPFIASDAHVHAL